MPLGGGLTAAAVGGSLIKSGFDFFGANSAQHKAEREMASLKRPYMKVQDEYFQNKNQSEIQAQQGLPESTRNYLTEEHKAGLGTGLSALKEMGGSPNDIAKLFSTYTQSISQTGAQDAAAHAANIQYFMEANKDLAGEKTKAWTVNELQPYEEKMKQLSQNIAADKLNKSNALNSAIGTVSSAANAIGGAPDDSIYGKLFGKKGGGASSTPVTETPITPIDTSLVGNIPASSLNYQGTGALGNGLDYGSDFSTNTYGE